jgi:hypothetical protein
LARGRKHGAGIYYWSSGDRWEGGFEHDERTEDGVVIRKDNTARGRGEMRIVSATLASPWLH